MCSHNTCSTLIALQMLTLVLCVPCLLSPSTGQYAWPTLADVNTRARRLVSAWIKHQKREEQKQVNLIKVSIIFHIYICMYIYSVYTVYDLHIPSLNLYVLLYFKGHYYLRKTTVKHHTGYTYIQSILLQMCS